ncbi:MAG: 3'(2'),5'-bisphosphate nucleotidase CysQ [Bacteroidetes bacterium]|nr:3'(2'),5'-bisphosphate nucleotidase CysQ [Bacteroidota bacterium]
MEIGSIYFQALQAAVEASQQIMQIYSNGFEAEYKADGSPITIADTVSTEILHKYLDPTGIPVTGEESVNSHFSERSSWTKCWCIDPLDGTKEFVRGNGEFAVNIALIENGVPIFGLIASPVNKEIIIGAKEFGVFIIDFENINNQKSWKKINQPKIINSPIVMTCSRSHHSGPVLKFIQKLQSISPEIEYVKKGSSLKFFDLATGKADAYPRFAPTMEWDIAAGQAILEVLGGVVYHAETGEPLQYNKENLTNPYFIAKTSALCEILP